LSTVPAVRGARPLLWWGFGFAVVPSLRSSADQEPFTMSHPTPRYEEETHALAWSPATETREDVKALLCRRSALTPSEISLLRDKVFPALYDTYVETLRCVVRGRGARGAVEMELVHEALLAFWDETVAEGFPESIQAKLLSQASGLARNYVRREGRNPATQALPTSSKEKPVSFPKPERAVSLKELARVLFERLSAEHQAVIDAVVLRDLTVADAARELGLHRTTASSRLTAAMALLDEWVDELLSPSERSL
jgi:DNA-directed RNA polymerase specialized sigma24 family protein